MFIALDKLIHLGFLRLNVLRKDFYWLEIVTATCDMVKNVFI